MSHSALEKQVGKEPATRQVAASPYLQPEKSSTVSTADPCRPTGILVIEDERLLRKVMEKILRKQGFAVWVAADGAEGVDLYRRLQK